MYHANVFSTVIGWVGILGTKQEVHYAVVGHPSERAAWQALSERVDSTSIQDGYQKKLCKRIAASLNGKEDDFSDVAISVDHLTEFQRKITDACRSISYGETLTYGELALQTGYPNAARAVGNVMRMNRVPLIVPCHRVVAVNGLGGYSTPQGIPLKKLLLASEKTPCMM